MHIWVLTFLKENKGLFLVLSLMLVFRSAVADWNDVPTGSMKPTIIGGDRILVDKMAYDIRVPFTHISLKKLADPQRSDIVIFDSKAADSRLVKRVVGLPGDVVSMKDNILFINNEKLDYQVLANGDQIESLLGHNHVIRTQKQGGRLSSFLATIVPIDHYLVLGDNRDNSADSRVVGFVPRNEIIGKTSRVVLSMDYDNYLLPRRDRLFRKL